MLECRIDLRKTSYSQLDNWDILVSPNYEELLLIYNKYCAYKKFKSVCPLFEEEISRNEVLGYYHENKLVAFSIIVKYDSQKSVWADQHAWDYANPELRIGINSLQNECAYYKSLGYNYLYLGSDDDYKYRLQGFELIGSSWTY